MRPTDAGRPGQVRPDSPELGDTGTRRGASHRGDLRSCPVTSLMSHPPVTVGEAATLDDALHAFAVHGVRHLVVVDQDRRCAGVLTDRVVAACWARVPMTFGHVRVSDIVGHDRPMVATSATLADAARTMRACGADAVVVVDEQTHPVGVVTTADLIALLAKPRLPADHFDRRVGG
jgi:CBS domain-containing protein